MNQHSGYLIPFTDKQLFAEKIVFLKHNKIEMNNFAANARKQVQKILELIKEKQ